MIRSLIQHIKRNTPGGRSLFFFRRSDWPALRCNFIAEGVENGRLGGGAWVDFTDAVDVDLSAHDTVAGPERGVHFMGRCLSIFCWNIIGKLLWLTAERCGS